VNGLNSPSLGSAEMLPNHNARVGREPGGYLAKWLKDVHKWRVMGM
jgi:hypothetical protein